MRLDRRWISARIPHQGSMCLLDEVLEWDAQHLLCRTMSHRARANPLRAHGRLGSACVIEYAAQAVAVHGALLQPPTPQAGGGGAPLGMLTSARGVQLAVERLDDLDARLLIDVQRLHADAHGALYSFRVRTGTQAYVAEGRLSVWLDDGGGP